MEIVDTTLRDGEQKAGIALSTREKVQVAKMLDSLRIYQIEAGIPAMGGSEKKGIEKIVQLGLKSRISTWNRMNTDDIRHSMDCEAAVIHISVPVSDIHIRSKLGKDRNWVLDNMKRCVGFARDKGFEVTIGMEDASRADFEFIIRFVNEAMDQGIQRIRYADTVGILHRDRISKEIGRLRESRIAIEMHAHNDLGMAVANSIAAAKAGAEFVDCTIGGIGERAGNCNYLQFITAAKECFGMYQDMNIQNIRGVEKDIMKIVGLN